MKKLLLASILLGSAVGMDVAQAMPIGPAPVTIGGGLPAGTLQQVSWVQDAGDTCLYTLSWRNIAGTRSTVCRVSEFKPNGDVDCTLNRLQKINTMVNNVFPASNCNGFDPTDTLQWGVIIVAGESVLNPGLGLVGSALIGGIIDSFQA